MEESASPTPVNDIREPTSESIKVLVRIRPLNEDEIVNGGQNLAVVSQDETSLTLRSADSRKQFQCSFDTVVGPSATQEEVYTSVRTCTEAVTEGFNRYA